MRKILWIAPLLLLSFRSPLYAQAEQQLVQVFGTAMSQADVSGLTSLLDDEVELIQPGEGGKYRKQAAGGKLADFLKKNPPARFQVKHQGASADGQLYAVGQLTTKTGSNFKVLMRARQAGTQYRIFKIDLLQP